MNHRDFPAHNTLDFRVLSDRQILKVFRATLETLQRTGVCVHNKEACELLKAAGAEVDGDRVYIPPHIIQDALVAAPRSFTLWSRDGNPDIQVVPDNVYFGPGPTCTYFMDPITGERRRSRRGDPGMTARVCDALPQIDYAMGLAMIDDVHPDLAPVYEYAEMLANTTKPILNWALSQDNMQDMYDMAVAVAGSEAALRRKPFYALFATHFSPLQHTDEDLTNVLWAAEKGLPIVYIGGGAVGSTAPITAAGSFVVYLAGALSGLAIIQLKKRGTRVCIGGVPGPTDLRTARPSYGGPEMSLYSAAMSDISRYLGVPFMGTAGASEAKTLDLQAAIESSIQVILSGLSGATLVHDVGFLDCADIGSLESLVMNDEIMAMARRVMRGIEISDETLMLDEIDRVGPWRGIPHIGGNRPAMSPRNLGSRFDGSLVVGNLGEKGSKTMETRIKEKLNLILETHEPAPLPEGAVEKIAAILQRAEARLQNS